ncbi:MAG: GNAT family N-acetyltransferase [Rhodobacteraceae bacterium]|nr:GNAT family N-acetyltransferase [Paracoccaceae bacterium]
MEISSIGFLSETLFQRYNGIVRDLGDCFEVRTPESYDFWFGNYLLLAEPPDAQVIEGWIARFEAIFADAPAVRHKCLQWLDDGRDTGAMQLEFKRLGWKFDQTSVLSATMSKAVRHVPNGLSFREITDVDGWSKVLEHHVLTRPDGFTADLYRVFKSKRLQMFRTLITAGNGHWYGAFKGTDLVADMGIFHREGISRFQEVSTHPDHRRQGICAALVHYVSSEEQAARRGNQMVILADRGEPAERVYKSLGYAEIEQMQSVVLRPKGWDG